MIISRVSIAARVPHKGTPPSSVAVLSMVVLFFSRLCNCGTWLLSIQAISAPVAHIFEASICSKFFAQQQRRCISPWHDVVLNKITQC